MSASRWLPIVRWVLAPLVFVCVAIGVDNIWTRVVIFGTRTTDVARLRRLTRDNPDEVPILGASRAHADYVPELIHPAAYNYGMDGASFEVIDYFLKVELRKHKVSPIVIDMYYQMPRSVGDVKTLIPFLGDDDAIDALRPSGEMNWRFTIPGLRYFGYYDLYLKSYLSEHSGKVPPLDRGFIKGTQWPPELFKQSETKVLEEGYGFDYDPDVERRLFEHFRHSPERKFILVYSPLHRSCFVKFYGGRSLAQFVERMRRFPNVVVFDWGQLPLPDEDFMDVHHLNDRGAAEFSRRLGAELRRVLD